MTDRVHTLTVVLQEDLRTEDVDTIANAIRLIRPVIAVEQHVANPESYMAEQRALHQLRLKFHDILWPKS